jgi:hypothetical protein
MDLINKVNTPADVVINNVKVISENIISDETVNCNLEEQFWMEKNDIPAAFVSNNVKDISDNIISDNFIECNFEQQLRMDTYEDLIDGAIDWMEKNGMLHYLNYVHGLANEEILVFLEENTIFISPKFSNEEKVKAFKDLFNLGENFIL